MDNSHHFTGLFAGDYFIHRFDFDGQGLFAYGLLRQIDENGKYHTDYQSQKPPAKPISVDGENHRVIGRISRRAYILAKLRSWPNTEAGVAAIVNYSAGRPIELSLSERFQLCFVR
jgi:hypothetical protein